MLYSYEKMSEIEDIVIALKKLQCKPNLHVWATPTAVVKTMKQIDPSCDIGVEKIVHLIQHAGGHKICIASLKSVMDRGFIVKKGVGVVGADDFKMWDAVLGLRPHNCSYPAGMTCDARTCPCKGLVSKSSDYKALSDEQRRRLGLDAEDAPQARQGIGVPQSKIRYFRKDGKLYRVTPKPVKRRVVKKIPAKKIVRRVRKR